MSEDLSFLVEWNSDFPLDRWWRQKYKIPFNSESHKSMSPKDMLLDFLEDSLYKKVVEELNKEKTEYKPGEKSFLKEQTLDDQDFEDINLTDFKY